MALLKQCRGMPYPSPDGRPFGGLEASIDAFAIGYLHHVHNKLWSTYDAVTLGIDPPEGFPATIQERAWTSPIWYDGPE